MKKILKNRLVQILVIVFAVTALLVVIFLTLSRSDYEKIEHAMVKNAKDYVVKNNINVTNQEFVFIRDLGIDSGVELCSKASGVVITNIGGSIKYYPYLKCLDYESKILDNSTNYIELKGSDVALVNLGTLYFDKGYTKKQDDIKIETVGEVPNEVGAYTINYVVTKNGKQKTIVKRIVIVSDVATAIVTNGLDNKEDPNLILKGESDIVLKVKENYEEPGYAAYDYTDGYLTKKVNIEPKTISTEKEGKQTITYTVKNSKGKTATVKRNIIVVKEKGDLKINLSTADKGSTINESVIEIRVSGADFGKIVLPDGTETPYTIAEYTAKKNGVYTFKVFDKYANQLNKSIVVDNIDSKSPTGTCSIDKEDNRSIIKVVAEDDSGVMSVDYIINGNETGFLAATRYSSREKFSIVDAIIKDVAGNTTRISCPITSGEASDETYKFNYTSNKPVIKCDSYTQNERQNLESKLVKAINDAGNGTRAGVVEAARFLIGGLNYKIPYLALKNTAIDPDQILGLYDKIGLNVANSNAWGCKVNGLTQGMNSASFIKWAFINAGVTYDDNYITVDTKSNFDKIKPGDIVLTACKDSCGNNKYSNSGLVIGIESNKIFVAHFFSNGITMTELNKSKLPKDGTFALVSLYDYANEGNLTDMWK